MKTYLTTLLLLCLWATSFAQNSDFVTALEIHDSIVGPVNVSKGYGSHLDYNLSSDCKKEKNSAWFKFTINVDTVLTFDIVPIDSHDDYDFIIFKCPSPDFINKIKSNAVRPDRSCFSGNYGKNGSTGLSEYSLKKFQDCGPGLGYVSGLPIKAGETCYLMVNFPYVPYDDIRKGFTIYFYNYWPNKPLELKLKKLETIVLQDVLFETNKAILKGKNPELDKLAKQLNDNSSINVEIMGYTDNTGNEKKNIILSEERAKAIADYLISKNIKKDRLLYKGMGSRSPLVSNNTAEGRSKNRRVEIKLIRTK